MLACSLSMGHNVKKERERMMVQSGPRTAGVLVRAGLEWRNSVRRKIWHQFSNTTEKVGTKGPDGETTSIGCD